MHDGNDEFWLEDLFTSWEFWL